MRAVAIVLEIRMNPRNQGPMFDSVKECTDVRTPERVRNVPKIESSNVRTMSATFHVFIMPRRCSTITECRKAVPTSHGIKEAFSTGSQPQYPPQPSST